MLDSNQLQDVMGSTVYDSEGNKIGKVGQVYLDDQTGEPTWVTVNTGFFGGNESFVPVESATWSGSELTVPFSKDMVKDAPNVSDDQHLSQEEERELYSYYQLSYGDSSTGAGWDERDIYDEARQGDTVTHSDEGAGYDETRQDDAMTRSEERVDVGTREQETGRARLRKYVVTENVTQTVPVRKERAVLEREPVTDANVDEATSGADITEAEHDVVLHEETPVVEKTVEPVERVRLGKEEVQDEESVSTDVRKEHIETEGDINDGYTDRR